MEDWREIIELHLDRYPQCGLQDIYKLIFQATMGISHLLEDQEGAKKSFQKEWKTIEGVSERIYEKIHPQGQIVRVYLRPLKKRGVDYENIWSLVTDTAREFEPDPELRNYLVNNLLTAPWLEKKGFSSEEVKKFGQYIFGQKFPVIHHSREFKNNYHPHYRLILGKYEQVLGNEG